MGHLSGIETKRTVSDIEVVSDDLQRVLRFSLTSTGITIAERKAHQSYWDTTTIATLDKKDASLLNTLIGGGFVYSDSTFEALTNRNVRHQLPDPNPPVDEDEQRRCSELDIERAKAANLAEQKELLTLENERDHANDKHITSDVPGCPACERRQAAVSSGASIYTSREDEYTRETGRTLDDEPLPF
jgi:hypothetical protein